MSEGAPPMPARDTPEYQMLLASLLDSEYWKTFRERARQRVGGEAGFQLGSLVPGLNTYMATEDAMAAVNDGAYGKAIGEGAFAVSNIIPPAWIARGASQLGGAARSLFRGAPK